MQRLGPDQSPPGLFAVELRPFVDDADDADGEREKFPIANERLVRGVGIGGACDGEHQCNNVGKLLPQKTCHRRMRRGWLHSTVPFGSNLAHGGPICSVPLLDTRPRSSPR